MRSTFLIVLALFAVHAAPAANSTQDSAQESTRDGSLEVAVSLDAGGQSGSATASVRIHAQREVVWRLITSCAETLHLIPGLVTCEVLETAPDGSWQRIRQVIDYSWYIPELAYEFRASYEEPSRVSIERISGDLRVLQGSWVLQDDGDYTIAHYTVALAPAFWVPHWLVRAALRRDLPKMLRALRARAESVQERKSD